MSSADVTDLLARARRNVLSADEKRGLDAALDDTAELRLLLRAGLGFDAEAPALPGDERLIARIASTVERRRLGAARGETQGPKPRAVVGPRARRFAPLLAAALYLVIGAVVGVAAAATYWALPPLAQRVARMDSPSSKPAARHPPAEPQLASTQKSAPALVPTESAGTNEHGEREHEREPLAVQRSAPSRRATPPSPVVSSALVGSKATSAAELYAVANQARVRGDLAAAIDAYLDLQSRFSGSNEANASLLTLGNLYLVSGRPLLALEQFRAHQNVDSSGFGVESLWGMSVALEQLGRRVEERQVLLSLLSRYPASAYESVARRKLAERD